MFNANVLDSEIIDTESEGERMTVVFPETWSKGALLIALGGDAFFE